MPGEEGLKLGSSSPGKGRGETNLMDYGGEVGAMRFVSQVGKRWACGRPGGRCLKRGPAWGALPTLDSSRFDSECSRPGV